MRLWFMGSATVGAFPTSRVPNRIKAILPVAPGPDPVGDDKLYPFDFDDPQMAQMYWAIASWDVAASWTFPSETVVMSGRWPVGQFNPIGGVFTAFGSEKEIESSGIGINAVPGLYYQADFDAVLNGTPTTRTATMTICGGDAIPGTPSRRYIYDPITTFWRPRLMISIPIGGAVTISIQTFTLGNEVVRSGVMNSHPISLSLFRQEGVEEEPSAFEFTVTPALYWEYRRSDGTTPIFDSLTGNVLPKQTPLTQVF